MAHPRGIFSEGKMTTEDSMSFQMGLHDNSESLKLKNGFKNNKKVIASNSRVFQQMQTL